MNTATHQDLYRDFKHVKFHSAVTLCFAPGSGGNFLASQLLSQPALYNRDLNEYRADVDWLELDYNNIQYKDQQWQLDLEASDLYLRAQHHQPPKGKSPLFLCHETPIFTSQIFDYSTDEMIAINVTDSWYPLALVRMKLLLGVGYDQHAWTIHYLLDHNHEVKPGSWHGYNSMIYRLTDAGIGIPLYNTPISWMWFCFCQRQGVVNHDLEQFYRYVLDLLWPHPSSDSLGVLATFNAKYLGDYRRQSLLHWAQQMPLTLIEYNDLFFRNRLPDRGALSKLNSDAIAAYTKTNIELMLSISAKIGNKIGDSIADRVAVLLK